VAVSEVKWPLRGRFGIEMVKITAIPKASVFFTISIPKQAQTSGLCNGHVTAVAVGKSQRLYS
jgi:hypothetical protein